MPSYILMPALSPTMEEGNLVKWHKAEGDKVKAGQVIAEIETDKATMEVEAPEDGTLLKIIVPPGTSGVKVGAPVAVLADSDDGAMTANEALAVLATKGGAAPAPSAAPASEVGGKAPAVASVAASSASAASVPATPAPVAQAPDSRVVASPLAKRLAAQAGIDLRQVSGTGPHGRIVRADIDAYAASKPIAAAASAPRREGAPFEAIPNSGMRKTIARRLTESKQQAPHFYLTVDCELDALLALRKSVNEAKTSKISVNDCVIRAVAVALQQVPAANASWTEDAILRYADSDVSVAVATPTGLITPIVRQAQDKSLLQISAEMKDMAARARDGKLRPEEYQGGGFSVSNLGMFGIRQFAAILNPPQACILAVGAGDQRAVVKNGQLAVATVMTCTLSIDHRAVDGAIGAEFLAAFKALIETPIGLLI